MFGERGCGLCHRIERPINVTIESESSLKGPDLWYAGSKFKEGFLKGWLSNPLPIRPLAYNSLKEENKGDHPALERGEAAEVAAYLSTLVSASVPKMGITTPGTLKGKVLFTHRLACYGCHEVIFKGEVYGGRSAPRLTGSAERLNPDWVYAFLSNPKAFKAVTSMPVYSGLLTDKELMDLASFVGGLR